MIYPNKFRIITSLSEITNQDEGLFYYIPKDNPPSILEDMRQAIKDMLERKKYRGGGGILKHTSILKSATREDMEYYYMVNINNLRYIAGSLVAWGQEVRMHDERINKIYDVVILLNVLDAFVKEVPPPSRWFSHTDTNKVLEKLQEERFLYSFNLMSNNNLLSLTIKSTSIDQNVSWRLTKAQAILWVEYLKFLFIDDWIPPGKIEFITTEEMTV
jgi:hypothetical protein